MTPDPRPGNTGVTPDPPLGRVATIEEGAESAFDWYEPTIDGVDDGRVGPALALATGGRLAPGKPRNGYGRAEVLLRGEEVLCRIFGGSARPGEVHLEITGETCRELVPIVRRLWPEHRVSRADSAMDFVADFEEMYAAAIAFANTRGLKHETITKSDGGKTLYIGSKKSAAFMRLYKKSEQLRSEYPEKAHEIPDGIVRAEMVSKPGKSEVKSAVSVMHPDDLWGMAKWATDYAAAVLGLAPIRTVTTFRRPSDWSRAVHFLGQQYGPAVLARAADVGSDAAASEVLRAFGLDGRGEVS
jgi:hypothetical protein